MSSLSSSRFSSRAGGAKPFALLLAILLVAGVAQLAGAAPLSQSPGEGESLFKEKCAACHSVGEGDKVGPDLQGVTARRERDWLLRWIAAPDQVLASGDPIATQLFEQYKLIAMPNFGLTPSQVESLVAYFEAIDAGTIALPVAETAPALPAGDAAVGRELFTGAMRFENGGPPCMGCHSIAGLGALGGGMLGPDLTPAFNKYGETGLANFLATIPTVTMNAVWTRQPLTAEEQADLFAFLRAASVTERPVEALVPLTALSVGGALILIAVAHLYWRKRLTTVRQALVARSRISS